MKILKDVPISGIKVVPCRVGGPRGIVKAFVVASHGNVVLIDTGFADDDGDRIVQALEGIGHTLGQVDLCILTHSHGDHVGGLKRLLSLSTFKVAAHRLDVPDVVRRSGCQVDVQLSGGEHLDLCGGLDVLHLPGHSPGSLGIYHPPTRSFFTGDVIFSAGEHLVPSPGYLADDPDQANRSAASVASGALDIENLFVAHGDDVYGGAMDNLKRILTARRAV